MGGRAELPQQQKVSILQVEKLPARFWDPFLELARVRHAPLHADRALSMLSPREQIGWHRMVARVQLQASSDHHLATQDARIELSLLRGVPYGPEQPLCRSNVQT